VRAVINLIDSRRSEDETGGTDSEETRNCDVSRASRLVSTLT
jgi:hypothetical protein